MAWVEIALIGAVLVGIAAGTALVVRSPAFWTGMGVAVFKALLPKLSELFRRMPEKEEEEMRREFRAGRGGEWLKKWHRRRRG